MLFRINVSLTEDDYFAFNQFHSIESKAGKKQLKKTRNIFVFCIAIMVLGVFMLNDLTYSIIFAAVVSFFSIVFLLFFKPSHKLLGSYGTGVKEVLFFFYILKKILVVSIKL